MLYLAYCKSNFDKSGHMRMLLLLQQLQASQVQEEVGHIKAHCRTGSSAILEKCKEKEQKKEKQKMKQEQHKLFQLIIVASLEFQAHLRLRFTVMTANQFFSSVHQILPFQTFAGFVYYIRIIALLYNDLLWMRTSINCSRITLGSINHMNQFVQITSNRL